MCKDFAIFISHQIMLEWWIGARNKRHDSCWERDFVTKKLVCTIWLKMSEVWEQKVSESSNKL